MCHAALQVTASADRGLDLSIVLYGIGPQIKAVLGCPCNKGPECPPPPPTKQRRPMCQIYFLKDTVMRITSQILSFRIRLILCKFLLYTCACHRSCFFPYRHIRPTRQITRHRNYSSSSLCRMSKFQTATNHISLFKDLDKVTNNVLTRLVLHDSLYSQVGLPQVNNI